MQQTFLFLLRNLYGQSPLEHGGEALPQQRLGLHLVRQEVTVSMCQNAVLTRWLVWAMWSNERSKKSFRAAQLSAGSDCSTLQQISLLLCRQSSAPCNWALRYGILVGPEIWTTDGSYLAQHLVFTQVVGEKLCVLMGASVVRSFTQLLICKPLIAYMN